VDIEHGLLHNVNEAIERYRLGVSTDFAVSLCWTPNDSGAMSLAWNIVLVQQSPIIGQKNVHIMIAPEPAPSIESIDKMVMDGIKVLQDLKAQQLAPANGGKKA
jgi:hypothetical protein